MDRVQTQEEITVLLANVFGDKKRINYEDYCHINQELSSEMFLSILTLLQTELPCSVNYYKYKNNYEKYVGSDQKGQKEVIKKIKESRALKKIQDIFLKN